MTSYKKKLWEEVLSPIYWDEGKVVMLDQRRLPAQEIWNTYETPGEVAGAIREMVIRGAPAIGCAAAMGVAAGARNLPDDPAAFSQGFAAICEILAAARPTAVNLFWAIERQGRVCQQNLHRGVGAVCEALEQEAIDIWHEDIDFCRAMGRLGAELIPDGATVLTHCNAGAIATGGYGTALGVIRAAKEAGKRIKVFADETRPFLQGARLTAWELMREGIDVTLICDNMAGNFMKQGAIDCVVVGSDRIARNGDVANKVGTYPLAVLAREHGVPFYVAAPYSTYDAATPTGEGIVVELRGAGEITACGGGRTAPTGVATWNPAFDVTPAGLVSAIVTEHGVLEPPYEQSLAVLRGGSQPDRAT